MGKQIPGRYIYRSCIHMQDERCDDDKDDAGTTTTITNNNNNNEEIEMATVA
jgi:hypothetical protein